MPVSYQDPPSSDSRDDGQESFDQLVISHQQRLYVFIRSMVFNPSDARDILQDVNIVLIRKKAKYERGTNFKAWAFTIARFECLSYLSRYKKHQWTTLDTGMLESLADMAEEDSGEMKPWLLALRQCLQTLSKEAQQLIHARYQKRISLDEAAELQQISTPAVKQKLYRIRNNLKKCILLRLEQQNNPNTDVT